jgi:hypothetical protein
MAIEGRVGRAVVVCLLGTAAAVLLLSLRAFGTTVVALIDKKHHQVVLAADSLFRLSYAGTTFQQCKIIRHDDCSFAMAGLLNKESPPLKVKDLAETACGLPGDLRHKADSFMTIARGPVTTVAAFLRANEPQFYADMVSTGGGELVMVAFAGIQKGNPSIFVRGFKITANGGLIPVSYNLAAPNNLGFFAGFTESIAAYIKANPHWTKMEKVAAARKFVEMEIAAHPEGVGPPVSILTIDKLDRQRWISPGLCEAPAPENPAIPTSEPAAPRP